MASEFTTFPNLVQQNQRYALLPSDIYFAYAKLLIWQRSKAAAMKQIAKNKPAIEEMCICALPIYNYTHYFKRLQAGVLVVFSSIH